MSSDDTTPRRSTLTTSQSKTSKRSRNVRFSIHIDVRGMEKSLEASIEEIGKCSLWMLIVLILCSWSALIIAIQDSIFSLKETMEFRCYIPELQCVNWTFDMKRSISMPPKQNVYFHCIMYVYNYSILSTMSYEEAMDFIKRKKGTIPTKLCSHAISDHGYFSEGFSFVKKAHLLGLCAGYYRKYLWVVGLIGRLLTELPLGITADLYGRKRTIQIATAICFSGLFVTTFATTPWGLFLGRILSASGAYSNWLISYLYLAEICSKSTRLMYTQANFMVWGVGYFVIPFLLYNVQNWCYLHAAIMTLIIVNVFAVWYMPESPRWLISRRKFKTAADVIAEIDATKLDRLIDFCDLETKLTVVTQLSFIFSPGALRKRLRRSVFVFAAAGVLFNTTRKELRHFGSIQIYNYFIILALITFLHPLTIVPLLHFIGRKITLTFLFAILSIICCTILIEQAAHQERSLLYLFVTGFSAVVDNIMIIYSIEMYPAYCNGTMLGFSATCGTLLLLLHEVLEREVTMPLVKYLWYTVLCTISTVTVFFLPETSNKLLPLDEYQAKLIRL